jgi:hypothetical protein
VARRALEHYIGVIELAEIPQRGWHLNAARANCTLAAGLIAFPYIPSILTHETVL